MDQYGLTDAPDQTPGAGLDYALGEPVGGQPIAPQPQTMAERGETIESLVRRGVPFQKAARMMGHDTAMPSAPQQGDDDIGLAGLLGTGARQTAEDFFSGIERFRERAVGDSDDAFAEDETTVLGEALGPTDERKAAVAGRYQDRQDRLEAGEQSEVSAFAGDVRDDLVMATPQIAGSVASGALSRRIAGRLGKSLVRAALPRSVRKAVEGAEGWILNTATALGAAAPNAALVMEEGVQKAAEQGLDLEDEGVRNRIEAQTLVRTAIETAGAPLRILGLMGKTDAVKRSVARGVAKRATGVGLAEARTEIYDMAAQEIFLDEELRKRFMDMAQDPQWRDEVGPFMNYVAERYGRDALRAGAAGFGAGGGLAAPGAARQQQMENARIEQDADKMSRIMLPLGMDRAKITELTKTAEGVRDLTAARDEIGRAETTRKTEIERIDREYADDLEMAADLKEQVNADADAVIDRWGERIGATKKTADLRREREAIEKEKRKTATDRARAMGIKIKEDVPTETIETALRSVDRKQAQVNSLQTRVDAVTDPQRRSEAMDQLSAAQGELMQAKIDAKQQVEGLSSQEALDALAAEGKASEADRRRAAQADEREAAIQQQAALEFTEGLSPEARAARAQEIIDEAGPKQDRGLDRKIRKLTNQRRGATTPAEIDRLTNEISDLEARRGLPSPAVEAARRELQAQGLEVPADAVVSRPGDSATAEATSDADAETAALAPFREQEAARSDGPAAAMRADGSGTVEAPTARSRESQQASTDGARPAPQKSAGLEADPIAEMSADVASAGRPQSTTELGYPAGDSPYLDILPELGDVTDLASLEVAMREWTRENGAEASAHIAEDGRIIAAGTNNIFNGVMPPREGFGDPTVTFTHTHPSISPFSTPDFKAMLSAPQPFRAVLPDQVIEMRPVEGVQPDSVRDFPDAVIEHLTENINGADPARMDLQIDMIEMYDDGRLHAVFLDVLNQAMDDAGLVQIVRPYTPPNQKEANIAAELFEANRSAFVEIRSALDRRQRAAAQGEGRGQVGLRRAETQEGDAEDGEDAQDALGDLLSGIPDERSSARNKRPGYNEARVEELTDLIIADLDERKAASKFTAMDKRYRDGDLTREKIRAGLGAWLDANGMKKMFAMLEATRAMNPGLKIPETAIEEYREGRGKDGTRSGYGKNKRRPNKEHMHLFEDALLVRNYASMMAPGPFIDTVNPIRTKEGKLIKPYFSDVSPELAEFVELTTPPGYRFNTPLKDPSNVDLILASPNGTFMSETGMEVAERTARHLQENAYTINEAKLNAIKVDDLVSGKALGRHGMKKDALAEKDRLDAADPETWTPEERAWMKNEGLQIDEFRRKASRRLDALRAAYRNFRAEEGPDAKVGFLYRIDNRGRIYADGSFHPQVEDKIKGIFEFDGKNLTDDMVTVDASASGWQVNALMARDDVGAPRLNLGRGQATEPGYQKYDMYTEVLREMKRGFEMAANRDVDAISDQRERAQAEQERDISRVILDNAMVGDNVKTWKLSRDAIKPAIIAMNYGGQENQFRRTLIKSLGPHLMETTKNGGKRNLLPQKKGNWKFITRTAMKPVEDALPHSVALQSWTIDSITKLITAIQKKQPPGEPMPPLDFPIGVDSSVGIVKRKRLELDFRVRQQVLAPKFERAEDGSWEVTGTRGEDSVETQFKQEISAADPARTARAVWANVVQSYDAAILHRAVERYKRVTDGAFITTNHDSFTVPPEHEGAAAAAVRESMAEIMGNVDVPRDLYEAIMAHARRYGVEADLEIQQFDSMGNYDFTDLETSTPVFGENAGDPRGEDFVPNYDELPPDPLLRRAAGEPAGEGSGVPNPADGSSAPAPGVGEAPGADTAARLPLVDAPTLRMASDKVENLDYMASLPQTKGVLEKARDVAAGFEPAGRGVFQVLEDNVFNSAAPIRRLEIQQRGELGVGAESAFKSAEMAVNDSGRQESLLYYGASKLGEHGEYTVDPDTMGLKSIFRLAAGEGEDQGQRIMDWMAFMISRRAQQMEEDGIKTPQTKAQIEEGLAKERPEFIEAAEEWRKHNNANIKFLVDTGRISQAQADAMMADEFYVPFYRTDERVDGTSPEIILDPYTAAGKPSSLLKRDPGIMSLKGGDKKRIENLMQNMIRNSQAMAAAGQRNRAANMSFDLMIEAGLASEVPISARKPDNAVRAFRGGKETWFIPTGAESRPMMMALAGLQPIQLQGFARFAADIGSLFRQSITLTPPFMIRNAIRGAVSTGVMTSGANLTLANNTLSGFRESLSNSAATRAFKASSGMGDYRFGNADVGFGKDDILIEFGLAPKTIGSRFRSAMDAAEHVGSATELADRVAAFQTMQDNGIRADEAAYQALTIMNYARKGGSPLVRYLLPQMPFLNARLQGLSRLTEGAVGKRGAKGRQQALVQMTLNGLVVSAATMLLWGLNNSDEERREKYMAEPLWRRSNYHILYFGEKNNGLYIPKAFELGYVFSTIPELFADAAFNEVSREILQPLGADTPSEVSREILQPLGADTPSDDQSLNQIRQSMIKFMADTVAFNAIPQVALPLIEVATNKDFFTGRQIEGMRESNLLAQDRTTGASPLAQALGRDTGLSAAMQFSPAKIEKIMETYGGIYWVIANTAIGIFGPDLGVTPKPAQDVFGGSNFGSNTLRAAFGSFAKSGDLQTERFLSEFYETHEHVRQIYGSARAAALTGDVETAREMLSRVDSTAEVYGAMNRSQRNMGRLNTQIRTIQRDKDMTSAEKARRLRALIAQRNKESRNVMALVRRIEEQSGTTFSQARRQ